MVRLVAQEILREGLDDWVPLVVVAGFARRLGARDDAEAVHAVLAAIREVAASGFVAWTEPLDQALARIERAWRTTDRDVWGYGCWLSNTTIGDVYAQVLGKPDQGTG